MMLPRWLFPSRIRDFPGKRWVKIALRTLHLIGVAGLGGAYLYEAAPADWLPYLWLALVSGLLMVTLEIWSHGVWLLQLSGQVILFKCLLLLLHHWLSGDWRLSVILLVLALSGLIAHAPARIRHFAPWQGRVLTFDSGRFGAEGRVKQKDGRRHEH